MPIEYTTAEAAMIVGCTPRTIRNMIERGTIKFRIERFDPTVKGVYKIPKTEIDRILKLTGRTSQNEA